MQTLKDLLDESLKKQTIPGFYDTSRNLLIQSNFSSILSIRYQLSLQNSQLTEIPKILI